MSIKLVPIFHHYGKWEQNLEPSGDTVINNTNNVTVIISCVLYLLLTACNNSRQI